MGLKNLFVRRIPPEEMQAGKDYGATMDAVQKEMAPRMRELGFRGKGRTYNRRDADGIIQIINIQLGAYPLGGNEIPGLRYNLHGKYTVNLGTFLPCVEAADELARPRKGIRRSGHLETRLGNVTSGQDEWRPVEPGIAPRLIAWIEEGALPHFERLSSYENVVAQYFRESGSLCPGVPPWFKEHYIAGLVAAECGQYEHAHACFAKARRDPKAKEIFRNRMDRVEATWPA